MIKKRIVITGIGPLGSVGIGKDAFWQGILRQRVNLKKEECIIDAASWGKYHIHKLDNFNIYDFGVDKDRLNEIKDWKEGEEVVDLYYLIAAIKLALDDSRIDYKVKDNRIGLVLAHENLGLMPFGFKVSGLAYEMLINKKKNEISKKDFFDGLYRKFLKSGYDVQTFASLFHVAKVFNVHNYSLFINNACASGLYALEAASHIIKNNQAEVVVAAAADYPDIYKYIWFRDLGIYSPDGKIRPFCRDSNGIVFGDGGIAITLEDFYSAKKRKANIYAEYLGGGFDLEGWKITVPQIGSDSYHRAIGRAFKNSGLKPEDIELLVPHGVGSQPIDYYEAKAITDTFGPKPEQPVISAFKPYVGHNLGASALLETAILLLSLHNNTIPATLNIEQPDPKFNISLLSETARKNIKHAMKICCAFAGFNGAAIFRNVG